MVYNAALGGYSALGRDVAEIAAIICTCNGVSRIRPTLDALARCMADFPVEVILVDNNSADGTAAVAREAWARTGNTRFVFRVVHEPEPGLIHARRAGVRATRSDILVFVDDDNWLDSSYLVVAHEIMTRHPEIGVLGGQAEPRYESEPPAWFLHYRHSFAIGVQGDGEGDVTETRGWVWGAGFVIRAAALRALDALEVKAVAVGRKGSKMTTGEDVELCLYLRELGWRIWYSPRLILTHFMPKSRFDTRRFRQLMFQNGVLSSVVVYPLMGKRGRFGAVLSAIKGYVLRCLRRPGGFDAMLETVSLAGKLYGFLHHGRKFATVVDNKRKLQTAFLTVSTSPVDCVRVNDGAK